MSDKLTASEAVYGLLGWLTTRKEPVTFGAKHDAGIAADMAARFCEVNRLADPREGWGKNLVSPSFTCLRCLQRFERPAKTTGWKLEYCSVECRKKYRKKLRDRRYYLRRKNATN